MTDYYIFFVGMESVGGEAANRLHPQT